MKELRLNIKGKNNRSWKPRQQNEQQQNERTPRFGQRNERTPRFGQQNKNKGFGKLNIPSRKTNMPNIPNPFGKKNGQNSNGKFNWKKL